jgi:hypothetical protein
VPAEVEREEGEGGGENDLGETIGCLDVSRGEMKHVVVSLEELADGPVCSREGRDLRHIRLIGQSRRG